MPCVWYKSGVGNLPLTIFVILLTSHAFVVPTHSLTIPPLADLAPQLASTTLTYQVAVGSKETPFQMKGMNVELSGTCRTSKAGSTGIYEANLLRSPWFISQRGEQTVDLTDGGWEVVWPKASPHGHLVCSFVSSQTVKRNEEASLEAGRFFLCHRVWTRQTLQSERERRREIQSKAAVYLDERDKKIKKITDEDGSVGEKVVSYAQAARSVNKYRTLGYKETLFIPLYDEQVLEISDDCIVSTRGMVYRIDNNRRLKRIGDSRVDFLKGDE